MNNIKILMTGGSGFVGEPILDLLKTKNIGPKSTLQIAKKCEMTYGFTLFTLPRINTKVTIQLK